MCVILGKQIIAISYCSNTISKLLILCFPDYCSGCSLLINLSLITESQTISFLLYCSLYSTLLNMSVSWPVCLWCPMCEGHLQAESKRLGSASGRGCERPDAPVRGTRGCLVRHWTSGPTRGTTTIHALCRSGNNNDADLEQLDSSCDCRKLRRRC